ncbi:MAG: GNAT family N-acetyltransferase [Acidimicrobiia bacterium]
MRTVVERDPGELVSRAGAWLATEPVLHNVICSVLARATADPASFNEAAWFAVEDGGGPVGVAIHTPPFLLGLTPMSDAAVGALADVVAVHRPGLPGVAGPGDVATRFARLWAERTGAGVVEGMEQLMYQLDSVVAPPPAPGGLRPAAGRDRELLEGWLGDFVAETGVIGREPSVLVDKWLHHGGLHLWEDGGGVTMAGTVPAVAGVVRVGPVYTPPAWRRRGYASACVAALSQQALDRGASACMLYTDSSNPTSNGIYQRIGYRRVAPAREYRFSYTG